MRHAASPLGKLKAEEVEMDKSRKKIKKSIEKRSSSSSPNSTQSDTSAKRNSSNPETREMKNLDEENQLYILLKKEIELRRLNKHRSSGGYGSEFADPKSSRTSSVNDDDIKTSHSTDEGMENMEKKEPANPEQTRKPMLKSPMEGNIENGGIVLKYETSKEEVRKSRSKPQSDASASRSKSKTKNIEDEGRARLKNEMKHVDGQRSKSKSKEVEDKSRSESLSDKSVSRSKMKKVEDEGRSRLKNEVKLDEVQRSKSISKEVDDKIRSKSSSNASASRSKSKTKKIEDEGRARLKNEMKHVDGQRSKSKYKEVKDKSRSKSLSDKRVSRSKMKKVEDEGRSRLKNEVKQVDGDTSKSKEAQAKSRSKSRSGERVSRSKSQKNEDEGRSRLKNEVKQDEVQRSKSMSKEVKQDEYKLTSKKDVKSDDIEHCKWKGVEQVREAGISKRNMKATDKKAVTEVVEEVKTRHNKKDSNRKRFEEEGTRLIEKNGFEIFHEIHGEKAATKGQPGMDEDVNEELKSQINLNPKQIDDAKRANGITLSQPTSIPQQENAQFVNAMEESPSNEECLAAERAPVTSLSSEDSVQKSLMISESPKANSLCNDSSKKSISGEYKATEPKPVKATMHKRGSNSTRKKVLVLDKVQIDLLKQGNNKQDVLFNQEQLTGAVTSLLSKPQVSNLDLRISGAICLPVVLAWIIHLMIPLGGGLFGTGLFMLALPYTTVKIGCKWLLKGNPTGNSEYATLITTSRLVATASSVVYTSTLLTDDRKVMIFFGALTLVSWSFAMKCIHIQRDINFTGDNLPSQVTVDIIELEWIKYISMVPLKLRVLSIFILPSIASGSFVLSLPFQMPFFKTFLVCVPLVTRVMSIYLLGIGSWDSLMHYGGGAKYQLLSMLSLSLVFLNPMCYIVLVFLGYTHIADLLYNLVGALGIIMMLAGILSFDGSVEKPVSALTSHVVAACRAWSFSVLMGVVPAIVPLMVLSFTLSNYISYEGSTSGFLTSRAGMVTLAIYILSIPISTLGIAAILRGPSSSVYALVFPWADDLKSLGRMRTAFGLFGWLSYAVAIGIFVNFARSKEAAPPGQIAVMAFMAWNLLLTSLLLHRAETLDMGAFNGNASNMLLQPSILSSRYSRLLSAVFIISGMVLFLSSLVTEFYPPLEPIKVILRPLLTCHISGLIFITHSYLSDIAKTNKHIFRRTFGWGLFVTSLWFGWAATACDLSDMSSPLCHWIERSHGTAISGMLGWVGHIFIGRSLFELALGLRKSKVVKDEIVDSKLRTFDDGIGAHPIETYVGQPSAAGNTESQHIHPIKNSVSQGVDLTALHVTDDKTDDQYMEPNPEEMFSLHSDNIELEECIDLKGPYVPDDTTDHQHTEPGPEEPLPLSVHSDEPSLTSPKPFKYHEFLSTY